METCSVTAPNEKKSCVIVVVLNDMQRKVARHRLGSMETGAPLPATVLKGRDAGTDPPPY